MRKYIEWKMEVVELELTDMIKTSGENENFPTGEDELPLVPWSELHLV